MHSPDCYQLHGAALHPLVKSPPSATHATDLQDSYSLENSSALSAKLTGLDQKGSAVILNSNFQYWCLTPFHKTDPLIVNILWNIDPTKAVFTNDGNTPR
jgi:hypothetical protein